MGTKKNEKASFRIERKDVYTIEVNDDGDIIEFDLQDASLVRRYNAAVEGVKAAMDKLQKHIEEYNRIAGEGTSEEDVITPAQLAFLEVYENSFKEMRVAMDKFLGEDGCQKIFGNRNYLEMWSDLFEALEPHVEKMGIQSESIRERIKAKYSKPDEGVLKG